MSSIKLTLKHSEVSNLNFDLSGSKSISQRALIINNLIGSDIIVDNLSSSNDTRVLSAALTQKLKKYHLANSGTSLRFLISFFALKNKKIVLTGDNYLLKRPIQLLIDHLNYLGANISREKLNIVINPSNLLGGELYIKQIKSSQFVSSLLLIAPYLKNGLKIFLDQNVYSKSYIDMTTSMMTSCGAILKNTTEYIKVYPGKYKKHIKFIESDWTSLSYMCLAFLFSSSNQMRVQNFNSSSIQPDSHVLNFFSFFGIKSTFLNQELVFNKITQTVIPTKIKWDFKNTPDLCPTFLVACLGLGVEMEAVGVRTLAYKESNRLVTIAEEMKKFNARIDFKSDDKLFLNLNKQVNKNKRIIINTYDDHRIALSFSTLVLLNYKLKINNYLVVNKSYPNFYSDLLKFGVKIEK